MDNTQRPEDGNTNTGCNVPAATNETDIQTALDDVQYLKELESHGNAPIFTSAGSADAREAIPSTQIWSDNICSTVHSHSPHFSTSAEVSKGFDTLGTYRNHFNPYASTMVSSDATHNRKRNASNYMCMSETGPDDKISKSEILSKRRIDVSADSQQDTNYDKTLGFNASSQIVFHNRAVASTDGQHIELQNNLSQIARNDNDPSHILDVVTSNSLCFSDDIFAVSGSSGFHIDENTPNVVGKMFHSSNKSYIKPIKGEEIKAFICRICKDEISQHVTEENVLRCVDSLYCDSEETNLRIHRSTHVPKTTCNICGKEHAVGNSHKNEHRCPDSYCRMTFPCRTRLYQHIPEHGKYFKTHCWVCRRKFIEHITEMELLYACCVCGVQRHRSDYLQSHSRLHLPRSFCNLCEKEYHVDDETFHGIEVKCFVCNDIFKCQIQFEEHFEGHVKYFSERCRVSESNEKNPWFRWPSDGDFQFLSEIDFKYRLYSHAGLIVTECETCGRRFSQKNSLNSHSPYCKVLPYKCEICETRFLTIDLLHSHGLVKHAG